MPRQKLSFLSAILSMKSELHSGQWRTQGGWVWKGCIATTSHYQAVKTVQSGIIYIHPGKNETTAKGVHAPPLQNLTHTHTKRVFNSIVIQTYHLQYQTAQFDVSIFELSFRRAWGGAGRRMTTEPLHEGTQGDTLSIIKWVIRMWSFHNVSYPQLYQ